MGKSKKSASKSTSQTSPDPVQSSDQAEARPIGEGKDPLSEGNTLANPTNSEAETHYNIKENGAAVQAAENTINGQDANQRAEQHNAQLAQGAPDHDTPNQSQAEQDAVAEGRVEANGPDANVNDTPEEVTVPERSEEQATADANERQDAVDTALNTTDQP